MLTDLITGTEARRSPSCRWSATGSPNWKIEPFRWLGVRYSEEAIGRVDAKAERTGRPPTGRSLAERLAAH